MGSISYMISVEKTKCFKMLFGVSVTEMLLNKHILIKHNTKFNDTMKLNAYFNKIQKNSFKFH